MARFVGSSRSAGEDQSLDLDIRNFGPIASASVSLRPLTVFIGHNNSGKSYAARLLHSVVTTLAGFPVHVEGGGGGGGGALSACRRAVGRGYKSESGQARLGAAHSQRATKALIESAFCAGLRSNIERNFESPAAGLVRAGRARSTVTISGGRTSNRPPLRVTMSPQNDLAVTADFKGSRTEIAMTCSPGACEVDIFEKDARGKLGDRPVSTYKYAEPDGRHRQSADRDEAVQLMSSSLADAIAREVQCSIAYSSSFYLPAGRSAIMQTYKDLAAGLITSVPRAGFDPGGPGLQGAVADLAAEIIRIKGKRNGFFELACSMEREMLSGSVDVSYPITEGFRSCCTAPTAAASHCRAPRRRSRRWPRCRCTSSMWCGAAAC